MEGAVATTLVLGFLLGIRHAIETDHVAAVATIVTRQRSVWRSSLVGAVWGVGHTVALLVAGLLVLGLRLTIPEEVGLLLEFLVGLMLVGLGLQGIARATNSIVIHKHTHTHGDGAHAHLHLHVEGDEMHDHGHLRWPQRSFWVGLLHGLAGSGSLTILVLATVPSVVTGIAYIVIFGAGSVLGMILASTVVALPLALTAHRFGMAHLRIQQLAGALSIAVGLMLAWETVRSAAAGLL